MKINSNQATQTPVAIMFLATRYGFPSTDSMGSWRLGSLGGQKNSKNIKVMNEMVN